MGAGIVLPQSSDQGAAPAPALTGFRALVPAIVAVYLAASILAAGAPSLGRLGETLYTLSGKYYPLFYWKDSTFFVWCYAWWPHALKHGLNPFVTDYLWYPRHVNLTTLTSIPTLSLIMAPVTALFGPVVSYNLVQMLTPGLNASAAFLLCRHRMVIGLESKARGLRRELPAAIGGWLFGFSPFVIGHLPLHPNLSCVALIPLGVLAYVQWREARLSDRGFVGAGAVLLAAQGGISLEMLAYCGLAAACGLALDRRRLTRHTLTVLALTLGSAMVLMSPLLYFFLAGPDRSPISQFGGSGGDLLRVLAPLPMLALHLARPLGHAGFAQLDMPEMTEYLGPFILLMLVWQYRRIGWGLVLLLASFQLIELGFPVLLDGQETFIPNPFGLVHHLPLMGHALIVRFSVMVWLVVAIAAARIISAGGTGRYALVGLACVSVLPNPHWGRWIGLHDDFDRSRYSPVVPAAFFTDELRATLRGGRYILLPYYGLGGLWQAMAGMTFQAFGDYTGMNPTDRSADPLSPAHALIGPLARPGMMPDRTWVAALTSFMGSSHVDGIVMDPDPWAPMTIVSVLTQAGWRQRAAGRLLILTPP